MNRENKRNASRSVDENFYNLPQSEWIVDVCRPMQRYDAKTSRFNSKMSSHVQALDLRPLKFECVNHDVPDELDTVFWYTFTQQMLVAVQGRSPKEVGKPVSDNSIDLLRHCAIAAAEPGFKVSQGNTELGCYERAGQSGVHVANDNRPVWPILTTYLLVVHHDAGGLLGMTAAPHPQVVVRRRQPEVVEESGRHIAVIMLPSVNEQRLTPVFCL